jgi:hypothetical protein
VLSNWAPRHEGVLGEWRYNSTHSLTSALDEGKWSASRPCRFTPRERAPGTHSIGGWVGPRAVLNAVKRKILRPYRESKPRTPIVQPVAQCYTDWTITAFRHIWEDNIKMDLEETECYGVDEIRLAQDGVYGKFLTTVRTFQIWKK